MAPDDALVSAIRNGASRGTPALVGYLTAGFPDRESFVARVAALAEIADAVEIGVPFSDPLADGPAIQRSSRIALSKGTTLSWILATLAGIAPGIRAPLVLMSYVNPLLAFGMERLPAALAAAGVGGLVVPDLPWEESDGLRSACAGARVALVPMVTPLTPPPRLVRIAGTARGFVYAVARTGTTGSASAIADETLAYLDRVRAVASAPVCAGFGIRDRGQLERLAGHADGVVVGTALVEAIERGGEAAIALAALRPAAPLSASGTGA